MQRWFLRNLGTRGLLVELHHSSYEMHTPARFSYEVHHSHVGVVREWCGSGAVGAPPPRRAVEPSTEPQARASGIVRDDGRLAMSISAHAARSTSAVGCRQSDCSRQRFAGCRVGEYMYMSSGCGVYLVLIAAIKRSNE